MSQRMLVPVALVALSAHPPSPSAGDMYYNTTSLAPFYYTGSAWQACGIIGGADTVPALTWGQVKNGVTLVTRVIPALTWGDVKNGLTL